MHLDGITKEPSPFMVLHISGDVTDFGHSDEHRLVSHTHPHVVAAADTHMSCKGAGINGIEKQKAKLQA